MESTEEVSGEIRKREARMTLASVLVCVMMFIREEVDKDWEEKDKMTRIDGTSQTC